MEGGCKRENDKCSLEENVLNGRLEIWSRYMQIDGKMKELIMEMIWMKWFKEGNMIRLEEKWIDWMDWKTWIEFDMTGGMI